MKIKLLIILLFVNLLQAEKCEYFPYNENYTRETVYDHIVTVIADDEFGCKLDTRDIEDYDKGIFFTAAQDNKGNLVIEFFKNRKAYNNQGLNKKVILDIWGNHVPEVDMIRDVVYLRKEKTLFFLAGYKTYNEVNLEDGSPSSWKDGFVVDYADIASYSLVVYKIFDNFSLRLLISDKERYFDGKNDEGFLIDKFYRFKYKSHNNFLKKVKSFKVNEILILNSLESFVKGGNYVHGDSMLTLKMSSFDIDVLKAILDEVKLTIKTLTPYNNIAYYLQKAGANEEAVYLLEKIIEKFPKRTVAYYNLGDAYWALGWKEEAKKVYETYVKQMIAKGKEKRIPKVIKQRIGK